MKAIEIAKRIEDGLKHMIPGDFRLLPSTVARCWRDRPHQKRARCAWTGLHRQLHRPGCPGRRSRQGGRASDEELLADEDDEEEAKNGRSRTAAVSNANLEELKAQTLRHFGVVKALYVKDAQGAGKERQPEQGLS